MDRTVLRLLALGALVTACEVTAPADGGPLDAPGSDAPASDAPGSDAPGRDAPARDASSDPPVPDAGRDAAVDAGPDVTAAVNAALDLICGLPAYASCTAPWACGCEVFGAPPPRDVDACVARARGGCEPDYRDRIATAFAAGGVSVDEAALADCIATARRSYDLCLPKPVIDEDLPASCWDAFTVGGAIGDPCRIGGVRCAAGDGVCAGRVCTAAADTEGAGCLGTCAPGLRCASGSCAAPAARGEACDDHEDCAGSELCVGGVCAPPVAPDGACDRHDRCQTGYGCVEGTCQASSPSTCAPGGDEVCPSGSECRSDFVEVCLPRGGLGSPCSSDVECAESLGCDFSASFLGTCARLPGLGAPCTGGCEAGLSCMSTGGGTCALPRRLGERCDDVSVTFGSICEPGLGCVLGTCSSLPRLDERCSDENLCEAGLTCLFDDLTFENRCRAPLPEGSDCGRFGGGCGTGLFCDFRGFPPLCRIAPVEGQECPSGVCAGDLDCRMFTGLPRPICAPPAGLGERCLRTCVEGAYCGPDPSAGACFVRVCDRVSTGGGPGPFPGPEPVPL
jgi:hypothetical protein